MTEMKDILADIFGDEVWDDNVEATTARVIKFWIEYTPRPIGFDATTFPVQAQQMVTVSGIEFASICAHHLLPFYGVAHVAYLPHKLQIGVSKIPRVVEWLSRSPQVQERLTNQIADWMQDTLEPKGTMVAMEAVHTCMSCRGVMSRNSKMVTTETRGIYLSSDAARNEFYFATGGLK